LIALNGVEACSLPSMGFSMMITRLSSILLLLMIALSTTAEKARSESAGVAGRIECYSKSCTLKDAIIIGDIDASTLAKVRFLLDDLRDRASRENKPDYPVRSFEIESDGGDVASAMEIGRLLRENRVGVNIRDHCYSSCVFVMAGAVSRCCLVGPNTGVGIHRPYLTNVELPLGRAKSLYVQSLDEMKSYLREMNVSERLAEAMLRVDPENMRILSETELESYGLTLFDPVEAELQDLEAAKRWGLDRREYLRRKAISTKRCDPIRNTAEWVACGSAVMKTGKAPPPEFGRSPAAHALPPSAGECSYLGLPHPCQRPMNGQPSPLSSGSARVQSPPAELFPGELVPGQ
jgi:hypothetical protein